MRMFRIGLIKNWDAAQDVKKEDDDNEGEGKEEEEEDEKKLE